VDALMGGDIGCGRARDTGPSVIVASVSINPRLAADRLHRACPMRPRAKAPPRLRVSVASRQVREFVRGDGACAFGSCGTERDRRFVQTYVTVSQHGWTPPYPFAHVLADFRIEGRSTHPEQQRRRRHRRHHPAPGHAPHSRFPAVHRSDQFDRRPGSGRRTMRPFGSTLESRSARTLCSIVYIPRLVIPATMDWGRAGPESMRVITFIRSRDR
jgi:hypothetical protein